MTVDAVNSLTILKTAADDKSLADSNLGLDIELSITTADGGDKEVEELGEQGVANDEDEGQVHDREAVDVDRVGLEFVRGVHELGVHEGVDHADGGSGDVLQAHGPDPVNSPVLAGHDSSIEITAELVALQFVSYEPERARTMFELTE